MCGTPPFFVNIGDHLVLSSSVILITPNNPLESNDRTGCTIGLSNGSLINSTLSEKVILDKLKSYSL